ncbi:MAG: ATP-grasp domain-containing protein [Candidatus Pacebacteria bacterium]|nr:ATP-grasp domain-containing protein [Candidatus Paceibacterota bacterium]
MKRVGILRGGISPQYDISLKTGGNVQKALADAGFEAIDMLLDKEGVLHIKGVPADMEKAQSSVDYIWNALHGEFGEDGKVQGLLDQYGIDYSGSGVLASAQAFNKKITKEHATNLGIKTPTSMLIMPEEEQSVSETAARIYRTMAPPWVIKPLTGGSSVNTFFAFTPLELANIIEEIIFQNQSFLVEQYIEGTEVAVGVIDNFRNKEDYILPVVDIKSPTRGILSFSDRQGEHTNDKTKLRPDEREQLGQLALKLHKSLGAKDYSQSEFVVDRFGKIWFLETDTHPALHEHAPFYKALEAVGATLTEFVKSVLNK